MLGLVIGPAARGEDRRPFKEADCCPEGAEEEAGGPAKLSVPSPAAKRRGGAVAGKAWERFDKGASGGSRRSEGATTTADAAEASPGVSSAFLFSCCCCWGRKTVTAVNADLLVPGFSVVGPCCSPSVAEVLLAAW